MHNDSYNLYNYYMKERNLRYKILILFKKCIFSICDFYTQQIFFSRYLFMLHISIIAKLTEGFCGQAKTKNKSRVSTSPRPSVLPCRSTPCRFAASSLLLA